MHLRLCCLVVLGLAGCTVAPVAPRHFDMNLVRQGQGYEVTGRYGPGWSEADVRGEVERACRGKSLSLIRFAAQPYSATRGTGFAARCAAGA